MSLSRNRRTSPTTRHGGFTLLEVMVALVIFSIGLLGLAGLQSQSLRYNHSAYLKTQASYMAYDILDRMRANREAAIAGRYNADDTTEGNDEGCDTSTATCSTDYMALHDIYEWKQLVSDTLPEGTASVAQDPVNEDLFTITIAWEDPGTPDEVSDYQLRSRI
ncbi:MAG: type IV pilus modification protein PilV [Thiohalophilus sp.]